MSDPQRREFLAAAAGIAALATLGAAQPAAAGDPSFMNNVPDPDACRARNCRPSSSRWRSRTARSSATASARKRPSRNCRSPRASPASRCGSSPARCANCTGTPPRPNGRSCSRAASAPPSIDPSGLAETNDFEPGDVWYFPRGHGHMLQCLGDKPCHFILIFDNGYFSEFGTFSITDWVGHTPKPLLAKNFGLPESAFDNFPEGGSLLCPRQAAACRALGAAAGLEAAAGDAQIPPAGAAAARDLSRRPRMAGRFQPLSDLEDDHRRRARSRSRRAADAALASERRRVAVRHRRRGQRHPVRLARPLPDRAIAAGRRRLHPARLRALDRECRQQDLPHPDRLQYRHLRDDRPVAMDRGKSQPTCWPRISASRRNCSENSRIAIVFIAGRDGPR